MEKQKIQFDADQILIKIDENTMTSEVDGEMVLMNVNSGEYFGLDEISSNIWRLIDGKRSFTNIVEELLKEYEVDEETCIKDTRPLLIKLLNLQFLKFQDKK